MDQSIVEIIYRHSIENKEKICLIDDKRKLVYGDFFRYIYGFSKYLASLGVKKGDYVSVITSQNIPFFIAGMAIQMIGGIFVPLERQIAEERLNEFLRITDSRLLISQNKTHKHIKTIKTSEAYDHYYEGNLDRSDLSFPNRDDIAEVLFTTGTTGTSKGVMVTHSNNIALADNVIKAVDMLEDNRQIIPGPFNHSNAIRRYYANIKNGSCVVIANGISFIQKFFNTVKEHKVTSMALVPANITLILKNARQQLSDVSDQIDYLEVGGSIFPEFEKRELCELMPNTKLFDFYGCTEAGCACTMDYNKNQDRLDSVGKPTVNSLIEFLDEHGNKVEGQEDSPGFLMTGGDIVMSGYFSDPELTAETLYNGFVVSKDLGYKDDEGFYYVIGRKDDIINMGSIKISPYEVEEAVNQHVDVADSICIPVKDEIFGEVPKIYVVMKNSVNLDEDKIKSFLKKKIDPSMMPKYYEAVSEIPLNLNGKKDRNKLKYIS